MLIWLVDASMEWIKGYCLVLHGWLWSRFHGCIYMAIYKIPHISSSLENIFTTSFVCPPNRWNHLTSYLLQFDAHDIRQDINHLNRNRNNRLKGGHSRDPSSSTLLVTRSGPCSPSPTSNGDIILSPHLLWEKCIDTAKMRSAAFSSYGSINLHKVMR